MRRRVASNGRRGEVGEGDEVPNEAFAASRVVDDALDKWFCLNIWIVWPMVRRVRHASGIVGRPIRFETAGLWSTYAYPGVRNHSWMMFEGTSLPSLTKSRQRTSVNRPYILGRI